MRFVAGGARDSIAVVEGMIRPGMELVGVVGRNRRRKTDSLWAG